MMTLTDSTPGPSPGSTSSHLSQVARWHWHVCPSARVSTLCTSNTLPQMRCWEWCRTRVHVSPYWTSHSPLTWLTLGWCTCVVHWWEQVHHMVTPPWAANIWESCISILRISQQSTRSCLKWLLVFSDISPCYRSDYQQLSNLCLHFHIKIIFSNSFVTWENVRYFQII